MEPMAGTSTEVREREERGKFRDGLRGASTSGQGAKRKRDDTNDESGAQDKTSCEAKKKKPYVKGAKGPNPLSVKKSKKKSDIDGSKTGSQQEASKGLHTAEGTKDTEVAEAPTEGDIKKKRRRKHKSVAVIGGEETTTAAEEGQNQEHKQDSVQV